MYKNIFFIISILTFVSFSCHTEQSKENRPNIILVMSDDQGWGQTGYYGHPILKTPHLDQMAENGLRLDRFYAGAPVCSPTRATVLTGRANDRSAVYDHGMPMRIQEKTIAEALKAEGYRTAHFGKWHLNGLRGPGVPILKNDKRNPGTFGFDEWISVTNFFDIDPLMSDNGEIKEYKGSSSDIIVKQALKYISAPDSKPFFVVIWYGSPHKPWRALEHDKNKLPDNLDKEQKNYLGEIVEIDHSIGLLRNELKKLDLSKNTLLWFNSDNGGLKAGGKPGVGGLRGFKGDIYEGGIRVPCVIEWPGHINAGQVSQYPASTMDIFPTIADILNLPDTIFTKPTDGNSIYPVFNSNIHSRKNPIPFKFRNKGALIDNDYKLVVENVEKKEYALYHLEEDKTESMDVLSSKPDIGQNMINHYESWLQSVLESIEGVDYEGGLERRDPERVFWWDLPEYEDFIEKHGNRQEYHNRLKSAGKI